MKIFEKLAIYLTLNILILKGTFGLNNFDFLTRLIYTSIMQLTQFRSFLAETRLRGVQNYSAKKLMHQSFDLSRDGGFGEKMSENKRDRKYTKTLVSC